ncbi:MAG TPA: FAD-dependent oxidoreductase [Methylomirabilota bacterium]|nr:FAD-dependent oxidoreductase [Methylomirabilota bacterium]
MAERARECRARVEAVRALTPEVIEADLVPVDPPALAFQAGQWVSVPFGPKRVRAYSIASTPLSPRRVTLCADVAPGGPGSAWFRALRPGAEVTFKGPLGGFVFSRADPRRPLFVAEEIGIVPIRSILTELYATGLGRPTALVYWARDPGWLVHDADFRSLARRFPAFAYHPVVRAAPADWAGARGEAAEAVARLVGDVGGLVAYVAGGEATIRAVREVLMARGLDRKAVKWEKFW